MDTIIHFIFWGLIEHIFFRIGRFVLWCISFGRVKLVNSRPLQVFLVATIGFLTLLLAIGGLLRLFRPYQ